MKPAIGMEGPESSLSAVIHQNLQLIPAALNMPRILFIIDEMKTLTGAGTERQLLQFVGMAARLGLSPQVCILRGAPRPDIERIGCPVKQFQIGNLRTLSSLRHLRRMTRWMREQQFSIVQCFFWEANLIGPWAARMAGVPVVLGTRRNMHHPLDRGPRRMERALQWLSNLLTDQIIVNSYAVLKRTMKRECFVGNKIVCSYNGIDLEQMRPLTGSRQTMRDVLGVKDDEILVGNVSGLRRVKGIEVFLWAAARARLRDKRLRFLLVGDGEMQAEVARMIGRFNLERSVILAGKVEDVRPYLAAMDIAVLSSHAEGFSNSLLEYMAAGLPTVATDVGGNREALEGAGLLVEAGNDRQLADAILKLVPLEKRLAYGGRARAAVERFDVSVAEERMSELYSRFLSRRSPGYAGEVHIPGIGMPPGPAISREDTVTEILALYRTSQPPPELSMERITPF
jgi:glycosyltransferase involved in cell wall biosynthesis